MDQSKVGSFTILEVQRRPATLNQRSCYDTYLERALVGNGLEMGLRS